MAKFIDESGVTRLEGTFGGHDPGAATVRGPFAFAFNTPGLENGLNFYTPTIGDVLLDAWFEVDQAWNGGSGALADIGTGKATNLGLWQAAVGIFNIASCLDTATGNGTGLLQSVTGDQSALSLINQINQVRVVPAKFVTADPWYVWVATNGQKGGAAVGGTTGSAKLYIVTATPEPLP